MFRVCTCSWDFQIINKNNEAPLGVWCDCHLHNHFSVFIKHVSGRKERVRPVPEALRCCHNTKAPAREMGLKLTTGANITGGNCAPFKPRKGKNLEENADN